jgi:hypothetical protein
MDFLLNMEYLSRINSTEYEPETFLKLTGFSEIFHSVKFKYNFLVDPLTTILLRWRERSTHCMETTVIIRSSFYYPRAYNPVQSDRYM